MMDLLEYIQELYKISIDNQKCFSYSNSMREWWAGKADAYNGLITLIQHERNRPGEAHSHIKLYSV